MVSRRNVLRVFNSELLRHVFLDISVREQSAGSVRESLRLGQGLTISRMETPPAFVGRSLREANLRAAFSLTVVGIRHLESEEDELPDPAEPLGEKDVLVVVGRPPDIERFRTARCGTEP
jgi:K+/H+ antiporter YhaU regulatory subunit KhtT